MTSVALRTTLLLAAILYGCDGQGYEDIINNFVCPDFVGPSLSQCNSLTTVNGLYNRDIRGVHYYAAISRDPTSSHCHYADFEAAISLTGDFDKLFGYFYVTQYNSSTHAYISPPLQADWIQVAYGRARSIFRGVTADQLIIARTEHGVVWVRCAPYNSPSAVPLSVILTRERFPSVAAVNELKQLALAAGFTTPYQTVSQQNCPPAYGHPSPYVITLDFPFF